MQFFFHFVSKHRNTVPPCTQSGALNVKQSANMKSAEYFQQAELIKQRTR